MRPEAMTHCLRVAVLAAAFIALGCSDGGDSLLVVTSGHVEATEVRVAAKVGGRLESLGFEEGDRVEAGQELARIETTDLSLAHDQARAERDLAAAELRLRLAGARKEDIAELEAQLRGIEADLAAARLDLARLEELLAKGSGTEKSRDDARARRDALDARREAARQALERARAGSRPEEIQAARARLDAAEARVAQIGQQIADAAIPSPLAGVVTEKLVEKGEILAPGAPVALVVDLDHAWLTVYVSEPDLARIRIGQPAEVVADDGTRRQGRISYVASQAEFTPRNVQTRDERVKLVFRIKIALENADGVFKPGMPAEARIRPQGDAG
jgi:HlyD family secretion protein